MKFIIKLLTFPLLVFMLGFPHQVKEPIAEIVYLPQKVIEEAIAPEMEILDQMTLEEKVGQLFIFGFYGTTLNVDLKMLIKSNKAGGLLLLGRNISNIQQLEKLITQSQKESKIPLFICIDQEGGTVARLGGNSILTISQSNMDTSKEAYDIAYERGKILKGYGININFAPVVEYVTDSSAFMYQRAFRGTKDEVIGKSISAMEGYSNSGIISVPKHFPGHSNTTSDPHLRIPTINTKEKDWDNFTYTFTEIVKKKEPSILMIGHILFPSIDSNISTTSLEIIEKRLKNDLNYQGVVLTDDMNMGAVDSENPLTVAKKALLAGNDMLMYSKDIGIQQEVYQGLVQAVNENEISEESINGKVLKILRLKIEYEIINPELIVNSSED